METKFYICRHCGNVIAKHEDSGMNVWCCGEEMQEIKANTVEASAEKHLPAFTKINDNCLNISVGSVLHPMLPEHHICFIYVETRNGGTFFYLKDKEKPQVGYCIFNGTPIAIYEYCNIHGLWKTIVK